jgi:hypothetical protein
MLDVFFSMVTKVIRFYEKLSCQHHRLDSKFLPGGATEVFTCANFPNIAYWFLNWVSFTGIGLGMVLIGTIKLITFLIKRTIRFGFYPRKTKVASHVY